MSRRPKATLSKIDIEKGFGLLEDHADVAADGDRVDVAGVDVVAVELDVALEPEPGMRSFMRFRLRSTVVLPQPEGPMNAGDLALRDRQRHVGDGGLAGVADGLRRRARRPASRPVRSMGSTVGETAAEVE